MLYTRHFSVGYTTNSTIEAQNKLTQLNKKYTQFCKETGLSNDYSRINVVKLDKFGIMKADNTESNICNSSIKKVEKIAKLNDAEKVKVLEKYEKDLVSKKVENAVVIDEKGQVYLVEGNSQNSIYIKNLGPKVLKNSYMTHNHPESETWFSLSAYDISEFMETDMQKLRGIDYKYTYEIEKTKETIKANRDEIIFEFSFKLRNEVLDVIRDRGLDADEYEYHLINELLAKKYKYKYRRLKND